MNKKDIQSLGENYELLKESSLSRIWRKTQKHSCGTITAFRGDLPYEENVRNNKKLVAYLQDKGYSVTGIQGTYIENFRSDEQKEEDRIRRSRGEEVEVEPERHVNERSYFVCNEKVEGDDGGELKNDLIKLGELFDQDSVMIIPFGGKNAYLYGTSKREESYPGYGEAEVVGSGKYGKAAGQFLSKIKSREFAFEDIQVPQTINGKRGYQILLKEIKTELEKS